MIVYNETTNKLDKSGNTTRAIVYITEDVIEFGYVSTTDPRLVFCIFKSDDRYDDVRKYLVFDEHNAKYVTFSNRRGMYMITHQYSSPSNRDYLFKEVNFAGQGGFPYTFKRYYEALESFNIFKDRQVVDHNIAYNLSKYLKYTFGVEFETSEGYLPEDQCFKNGLIPLRDGSITGLEYSTVVLNGNFGLNLLRQQVESLSKYTYFNKECALHIHMGGFPIAERPIFILYSLCCLLENELIKYVPQYTFQTSKYKENGKDYCKYLPRFSSFNNLYEGIAEQAYFGNLYQPHPHDVERNHKWDCHSR